MQLSLEGAEPTIIHSFRWVIFSRRVACGFAALSCGKALPFRRGFFDLTPLSCRFAVQTDVPRSAAEPQRGDLTKPRSTAWAGDVGPFRLGQP